MDLDVVFSNVSSSLLWIRITDINNYGGSRTRNRSANARSSKPLDHSVKGLGVRISLPRRMNRKIEVHVRIQEKV